MDLSNYQKIDPNLLIGIINTILRNHFDTLEDLCQVHSINQKLLEDKLRSINYIYKKEQNQFR